MSNNLERAFEQAKNATKMLFNEKATIYTIDDESSSSPFADDDKLSKILLKDEPVRVSHKPMYSLKSGGTVSIDEYDAIIILDNKVRVPAGSLFEVTDENGNVTNYRDASAGFTAYKTHQEIAVKYEERK